ncbi:MAG: hypothetical protein A2277_18310 [Desulfobacterales bacterium RIFOXYA12_FULL_46_15]|nr:MAG: hypothetical protein A2277_18310 [Desulfobacterales bacterium RIFOXYA12_FULL_46_15]
MTDPCIFFPFSHISQDQLDALQAFFSSFIFFPAAADLKHHERLLKPAGQGVAIPVLSSGDDLSSVNYTFEQYMAWAKVHKGNEHNLRSLLKDNPYFTSDSDLFAIKSQIRGITKKSEPDQQEQNVLHQDLLFLQMAKQCDQENESIDLQLGNIDKTRDRMFSTLMGEEDPVDDVLPCGKRGRTADPGAMMTRERIKAWSRCMIHSNIYRTIGQNPLFVTTSGAVIDYLETICSDVINALDINLIKVHENECENKTGWQQQVFEQLEGAAKGDAGRQNDLLEVNDECSVSGQIKLSLFSGNKIHDLFNLKYEPIAVCLIGLK